MTCSCVACQCGLGAVTWRDLSDDELRARLVQRRDSGRRPVPDLDVIDLLVRERDTADVAPLIDELLE